MPVQPAIRAKTCARLALAAAPLAYMLALRLATTPAPQAPAGLAQDSANVRSEVVGGGGAAAMAAHELA